MKIDIKCHAKIKNGKFHNYVTTEKHSLGSHETTLIVDGVEIYYYKYGLFYKIKEFFNRHKTKINYGENAKFNGTSSSIKINSHK